MVSPGNGTVSPFSIVRNVKILLFWMLTLINIIGVMVRLLS